jgi:acetyl-CoA carboxylase biotin carboxyl carrier protein
MSKARTSKPAAKKETSAKSFSGSASSNQPEMKTSEIRDLIDFISKTGLNEVNIETQQLKLHVKREPDQKVFKSTPVVAPMPTQMSAPVQQSAAAAQPQAAAKSEAPAAAASTSGKKTVEIKSPMIGTFYRSSGPEAAPFVSVGDKVSKGQTVCIIEAMKLFNEIESEVSGTIVKVMAENSSPVEYDQVLFVVEPD